MSFFTLLSHGTPRPGTQRRVYGGAGAASHTLEIDESQFAVHDFSVQGVDG